MRPSLAHAALSRSQAVARIFRMLDGDHDGLLSLDEFTLFQTTVDGLTLPDWDNKAFFEFLATEDPTAVTDDGEHLTEDGFSSMMRRKLETSDTAEDVWRVLAAFRYRLGKLETAGATTAGPPGLQLSPFPALEAAGGVAERVVDARCRYTLSAPPDYDPAAPPDVHALAGTARADTGVGFLAGVFARFAGGAPTLSCDALDAVFAVCPTRRHPFGGVFPYNVEHGHDGALSLSAWLQLWGMLALTSPLGALTALYELGFAALELPGLAGGGEGSDGGGTPILRLRMDPAPALAVHAARGTEMRRRAGRAGGYTYLDASAPVARVFVLGSAGAGKTTAVMHALGPSILQGYAAHVGAATGGGTRIEPTLVPTHYVVGVPERKPQPPAAGGAAPAAGGGDEPQVAATLVITVRVVARAGGLAHHHAGPRLHSLRLSLPSPLPSHPPPCRSGPRPPPPRRLTLTSAAAAARRTTRTWWCLWWTPPARRQWRTSGGTWSSCRPRCPRSSCWRGGSPRPRRASRCRRARRCCARCAVGAGALTCARRWPPRRAARSW